MTGDRDTGVSFLKTYFDISGLGQAMTFDDFVAQYDARGLGRDIEYLGGAVRAAQRSATQINYDLMRVVEQMPSGQVPNIQTFESVLYDDVTSIQYMEIIKKTVEDVKTTVEVGARVYAAYIAGAAVVGFLLMRFFGVATSEVFPGSMGRASNPCKKKKRKNPGKWRDRKSRKPKLPRWLVTAKIGYHIGDDRPDEVHTYKVSAKDMREAAQDLCLAVEQNHEGSVLKIISVMPDKEEEM